MSEQFEKVGDGLLVRAPGKVNLSLLVAGKRPDGFHNIESVMAKIDWYDEILIERRTKDPSSLRYAGASGGQKTEDRLQISKAGPSLRSVSDCGFRIADLNAEHRTENAECRMQNIELICKGEYRVPQGEENLVYKAAKLILEIKNEISNSKLQISNKLQLTKNQISNTEHRTENAEGRTEDPASLRYAEASGGQKTEDGKQNVERPTSNAERRTEEKVCTAHPTTSYSGAGETPATQAAGADKMPAAQLRITLTKNMPAGSGLGSGSSDAAATLSGINKFLNLGLGKKELAGLAAKLGSDVTFFLDGPIAFCTGKGEKAKKLEKCEFGVFLLVPNVSVSTARVYENYRHDESRYRRFKDEINVYIEKNRLDLICSLCANMLEESCFELHPQLGVLKKRIESLGIRPVCLSGSGSAMYCVINDRNRQPIVTYGGGFEREFGCKGIIVNNNAW